MNAKLSIHAQRVTISLEASHTWPMIQLLWEAKAVVSRESLDRIMTPDLRVAFLLSNPEFEAFSPWTVGNHYIMIK